MDSSAAAAAEDDTAPGDHSSAALGCQGRGARGALCPQPVAAQHCQHRCLHRSNSATYPVLLCCIAHTLLLALWWSCCAALLRCCAAVLCCAARYCFESDVPINMEGQEALMDWALLRMGLTGHLGRTCFFVLLVVRSSMGDTPLGTLGWVVFRP